MSARKRCFSGATNALIGLGIRMIWVTGLLCGVLATNAMAQGSEPGDAAMASLIQSLTNRRLDDLTPQRSPSGHESIDLKGRFQQVSLGQFVDDEFIAVACVNSVGEANTFFGRDLETGLPLPPEQQAAHDQLVAEALMHGMSSAEYQFYGEMAGRYLDSAQAAGSTITIINYDDPNEGFNSTAAQFLPAPGNENNANLGAQRLALFNAAAQVWGAFLDSSVTISVRAQFDPLTPCSSGGGVLGSAGTVTIERDFPNAEYSNTYYHQALANKQAGSDLAGGYPDINTTFNSDVDTGCLGSGSHFYYGLDNATPPDTINLFIVLLHELGHGLGSSSFTSPSGSYLGGEPDIWARFQYDSSNGLTWFQMNDAQRAASAINNNNLYWDGPNVRQASGFLTAGRETATGRVQLYAPNPYKAGSSVSHFNKAAFPNLLMEPSINVGLPLTLDLTRQQMRDIGWYRDSNGDLTPDTITNVLPSGSSFPAGSVQTVSWNNTGGFNRNVTIELSLDGGTTFPVLVASDISNTGSYSWTVPEPSTQQGRLRVREHDFLAPSGMSAANFIIQGSNTPPTFTPAAAVARQQGNVPESVVVVGTVSDAETLPGALDVTQIAGGTANGIVVDGITNVSGTISATVTASCTATPGTVRFQVSDGTLTGTGDLQVNVDANTPPSLTYASQALDAGATIQVNPATGPLDNGSVTQIVVHDTDTYSGSISVNSAGVVSLSAAAPIGTHTITVRATDNCGATTDAQFELQVDNTPPTFIPSAPLMRQQGSASGPAVVIGTVDDVSTPVGSLIVTEIAGGTATGIDVGGINNVAGTVSATLAASCDATAGTVRFSVSDGDLTGTGELQVNVDANTPPTLGTYTGVVLFEGQGALNPPLSGPADNGSVDVSVAIAPNSFAGSISANQATGEVEITAASPVDSYLVTVTVMDNCDMPFEQSFTLDVKDEYIFSDGFETP